VTGSAVPSQAFRRQSTLFFVEFYAYYVFCIGGHSFRRAWTKFGAWHHYRIFWVVVKGFCAFCAAHRAQRDRAMPPTTVVSAQTGSNGRDFISSILVLKQTNDVNYFWQSKSGLSPHALHTQAHKRKYIQTCQTLQMLLIISYSVSYK